MKNFCNKILEKWYIYLVGVLFAIQALVFLVIRENSYLQIHDNLDLFMAHYQMMKLNKAFFAHNVQMPMLHGINRDLLGSEFSLYNILYVIFPNIWAYLIGYALKIAIGTYGFILLAKDVYKEKYVKYRPLVWVIAAAYGMIPVFPTYGIAFTSVPIIVWLLKRLYETKELKKRIPYYVGVFCYPLISYFSYHGFFILCYMVVAFIALWIMDKKFPKTMFASLCILSAGFMVWEYRLFGAMLFEDTVTIRTTMRHGDISFVEALKTAFGEFVKASFHSQDNHTYIVLGVCMIGIVLTNIGIIRADGDGKVKKIFTEPVNLIFLWMVFNVLIFGFYEFAPFRELVETIVPKLTGFEFARTAFFNPFLWHVELLLVTVKMYDYGKMHARELANVIVALAAIIVMFVPSMYNDFYYNCYNYAYKIIKHKETSTLNYREFYSTELFDSIKECIDYNGEWSVAYGLHPAVLNYNGIATLDGYLGMYSQEYKDTWSRVIAPSKAGSPSLWDYFESWGARVTVFSGSDENTYAALRVFELEDNRLVVDMDELKKLDCKYIFSRIQFSNADEYPMKLKATSFGGNSPYVIYIYEIE